MVHPTTRDVYVLLGRGRAGDWDGAGAWSEFGGVARAGESVETAAAREFVEESLETLVRAHDAPIFTQSLLDSAYVMRLSDGASTTFVVRFDWNPAVPYEFSTLRRLLSALNKLARGFALGAADRAAVSRLRWLSRDARVEALLRHPAVVVRPAVLSGAQLTASCAALQAELGLKGAPRAWDRPAATPVVHGVRSEWLEKDAVQLFSVVQIRQMLSGEPAPCKGRECAMLAPSVIPILATLVRWLHFQGCIETGV